MIGNVTRQPLILEKLLQFIFEDRLTVDGVYGWPTLEESQMESTGQLILKLGDLTYIK